MFHGILVVLFFVRKFVRKSVDKHVFVRYNTNTCTKHMF